MMAPGLDPGPEDPNSPGAGPSPDSFMSASFKSFDRGGVKIGKDGINGLKAEDLEEVKTVGQGAGGIVKMCNYLPGNCAVALKVSVILL